MNQAGYRSRSGWIALFIALIAGLTLVLRVVLRTRETGSVIEAVSYLSQFFTILTNLLVFCAMLAVALGYQVAPRLLTALTIAIVGVGIVYHTALAHLLELSGLALLADHGVHTVVPALTLLWWLLFAQKPTFQPTDILTWIAWPLIYCAYILLRASGSGFYPYPFLNVSTLGAGSVAFNVVALCVAFVFIGLVLVGLKKLLPSSARV